MTEREIRGLRRRQRILEQRLARIAIEQHELRTSLAGVNMRLHEAAYVTFNPDDTTRRTA